MLTVLALTLFFNQQDSRLLRLTGYQKNSKRITNELNGIFKDFLKYSKDSKRFQRMPKDSLKLKDIPKDFERFLKNPKDSKRTKEFLEEPKFSELKSCLVACNPPPPPKESKS